MRTMTTAVIVVNYAASSVTDSAAVIQAKRSQSHGARG